jgi:hypothetical protein
MKKTIPTLLFVTIILSCYSQDTKIGLRFKPLNSSYMTDEYMNYSPSQTLSGNYRSRFDSLTIGIFFEKFFSKKGFLIRADVNYANMHVSEVENTANLSHPLPTAEDYADSYKQKYININLGIGTHANLKVLFFTIGVYVPFTILPKGEYTREITYYQNNEKTSYMTGKANYKGTMGIGIGFFGGVSATLFKHLSIGLDINYEIDYFSRKLTWHSETNNYGANPYITYTDENIRMRNFFTSKVVPSIVIAYAFNAKKNVEK